MRLSEFFVCTAILDVGPGPGKAELVGTLLALLARQDHLAADDLPAVREAVLRREGLGSTGVGGGVAVPHARHPAVRFPMGVLAVCRPAVEFDALDGGPVDIVALCLSPPSRPGEHLGRAGRGSEGLMRRLADADFLGRLRRARSAGEIEALLRAVEVERNSSRSGNLRTE